MGIERIRGKAPPNPFVVGNGDSSGYRGEEGHELFGGFSESCGGIASLIVWCWTSRPVAQKNELGGRLQTALRMHFREVTEPQAR